MTAFTRSFNNIANGETCTSERRRIIPNPATQSPIASIPVATAKDLDTAVDGATRAFSQWANTSVEARGAIIKQLGDMLKDNLEAFTSLVIEEVGKARELALIEVGSCIDLLYSMSRQTLPDEVLLDNTNKKAKMTYVPLGVCAAITPWNFPMSLFLWKLAPALFTGNCLIVKPSPYAPLSAMKFVEMAQKYLPPGVLSVLADDGELGPLIAEHPGIARISLTGSIPAGKSVMRAAAATLKSLTLELGGNDPALVYPDVNPTALAPRLFWGSFHNAGQICVAIKRVYVHDDIYEAVLDELVAYAQTVKIGDPSDPSVGIGPVQNEEQYRRVMSLIDDCRQRGYRFACGGEPSIPGLGKGHFVPITIVDNPPQDARIVQEEQFGPVLPLMRWKDEEAVIAKLNHGVHGLAATIWTNDTAHAETIASRIEAGTVWINESQAFQWDLAFGGVKESGIGVEHSKHGIYSWTHVKSVTMNKTVI